MLRMRGLKPDVMKHEGLIDLEESTGLPIRLCFIGLWTACDRRGRFLWRPRSLRAEVFPLDTFDFAPVLDALESGDFVRHYTGPDGREYGWIPGFPIHQNINPQESESVFPPHPDDDTIPTRAPRVRHASPTRQPRATDAPERAPDASRRVPDERKGKEDERKGTEPVCAPAPAREGDEPFFVSEAALQANAIVDAYPANGNRYGCVAAVLTAIQSGEDPVVMLAKVRAHAACWHALPLKEQRYCPSLDTYFAQGRWRDNPRAHPWTLAKDGPASGPSAAAKKMRPPPDAAESAWLAAARELWPDMAPDARKADIPVSRQRRVDQFLAEKKEGAAA